MKAGKERDGLHLLYTGYLCPRYGGSPTPTASMASTLTLRETCQFSGERYHYNFLLNAGIKSSGPQFNSADTALRSLI